MFGFNPVPKSKQLHKLRIKPTARQRGAVSTKVRQQLYERSKGYCERCGRRKQLQAAHVTRRWKIEGRTTVDDLIHLCVDCHIWADNTAAGRQWLRGLANGSQ